MPGERIQRQIDRLLDETEQALAVRDWPRVRALAEDTIRLDPENADAQAFLAAADRGTPAAAPSLATDIAAVDGGRAEPATQPALPPSFASGRYQVRRFLGEGGRKRVYLAHDARLQRDVAVAVIKTDGLDESGMARVRLEAQAMGQLGDHPHIVTIHDSGDESGQPYIVTQHMPGGSVEDLIRDAEGHQLRLEETLRITSQVCRGLEYAHGRGIVHRDLKPGNVWLSSDGTASVGDFGLVKSLDRSRLTLAGIMVGTASYMPPEQALGGEVTPQADLYALGAMLYELVTGRPPFLGDDLTAVISQHINTPPVAPSWLTERCPPGLEELILRLLAKDPGQRPASATEVLAALERVDPTQKSAAHGAGENPLERLARGVFVGRHKEMERLRKAFDEAFAGRGGMVMLVGEPGIGKTRAALELETYARMRGAQVLWGRAHESSGAPAYSPWVQVGDAYNVARGLTDIAPDMAGKGQFLGPIFPWVRQQPGFVEPEAIADAEAAQFRLFDAFATFVRAMSNQVPLLIELDDLHWADKPSLELLQFVARELARLRVLIVGNYRDTDLTRTHPLSDALARLNREAGFDRVVLRGLSRDEVAGYIRGTANVTPRAELVDRIYEETEGNPFFLSEVVNLLAQEGKLTESVSDIAVPDGVREALGRRLDRISEEANELLQTAAVAGREFTYEVLSLIGHHNEDELARLIDETIDARVVEEMERPGRYRFKHALMQETLLDELSTTRRVRLHGQVAEALERRWGARADERATRLALHFVEAAMLSPRHAAKAVHYAKLAAHQAEAQFGWDEAARHYEHCLTLVSEAEDGLGEDEPALLVSLGACARNAGRHRDGWRALMRAVTLYRQRADGAGVARATVEALGILAPIQRQVQLVREALDALGSSYPYLEGRLLFFVISNPLSFQLSPQAEEEAVGRLRQLMDAHGYEDGRAALVAYQAQMMNRDGDFERAAQLAGEAYERFAAIGQVRMAANQLQTRSQWLLSAGLLDRAREATEEALAYARRHHLVFFEQVAADFIDSLHLARCEFEAFDRDAEERGDDATYLLYLMRAARAEAAGDPERAVELLPDPAMVGGAPGYLAHAHAGRARILFSAGRIGEAQDDYQRMRAAMEGFFQVINGLAVGSPVLILGEALPAVADDAFMRTVYEARWGDWYDIVNGRSMKCALGAIALHLGETDAAERLFSEALAWCERERCPIEAGRCLHGLAEVADRRGDRAEALKLLDRAAALFQQHGARLYLDRVIAKKLELQGLASSGLRMSIDAVTMSVQGERPDLRVQAAPDGTVTIMFGDIEGSTPLNRRLGDAPYAALLHEYTALVRTHVETHTGRVVKSIGDGFMAAFALPADGLTSALDIQRAVAAASFAEPIRVRIGLHAGSPVRDGADFFGVDVTLASRITDLASGGEVIVSSALREAAAPAVGDDVFCEPRAVELKGLPGTHTVYNAARVP